MNNMNNWIEHLHHPLVFAGFGLFLFATVIKLILLNSGKFNGTAKERVMSRGMYLAFILALSAVIGGIALSWKATTPEASPNPVEKAIRFKGVLF